MGRSCVWRWGEVRCGLLWRWGRMLFQRFLPLPSTTTTTTTYLTYLVPSAYSSCIDMAPQSDVCCNMSPVSQDVGECSRVGTMRRADWLLDSATQSSKQGVPQIVDAFESKFGKYRCLTVIYGPLLEMLTSRDLLCCTGDRNAVRSSSVCSCSDEDVCTRTSARTSRRLARQDIGPDCFHR